jgi:hypothetical protein
MAFDVHIRIAMGHTTANLSHLFFNQHTLSLVALFFSIIWMLRDERDKTRPILVITLVINLFYGFLLNVVLGKESGLVPWKYDYVLARLDASLGLNTPGIALCLQWPWRPVLAIVYDLMVPMMIVWYLAAGHQKTHGFIVLAYIAELLTGPLLYAIVPACGPFYAFRSAWLHPPVVQPELIRLSGMPNAFPSLHLGTAVVFVFFSRTRGWRLASLLMLAGTTLATLATGEHYCLDLVAGMAFGCFAAYSGRKKPVPALLFLGIALGWSLAVRFQFVFLIDHPELLKACSALSVFISFAAVANEWLRPAMNQFQQSMRSLQSDGDWQESFTRSGD